MIGARFGARIGAKIGASIGGDPLGNSGALPFTTLDGTSGKAVPSTAAEFTNAGFQAPGHIWLCQEASGNLADSIGGKTLTAVNTPGYQQAVSGWTRKAIGPTGAATTQSFNNSTMANLNASSAAFLCYVIFNTTATNREQCSHGGTAINSFEVGGGTNKARLRTNSNAANTTLDHVGAVHPIFVKYDKANSLNVLYSDIEKLSITFDGAAAGAVFTLTVSLSSDTAASSQFLWAADWEGSAAENWTDAKVKSLLTALKWSVSGY